MIDNDRITESSAGRRLWPSRLNLSITAAFMLSIFLLAGCSEMISFPTVTAEATAADQVVEGGESSESIPPTSEPVTSPENPIEEIEETTPASTPEGGEETATLGAGETPEAEQREEAESTTESNNDRLLAEIDAIRSEIEANVAEVRGLTAEESVQVTLLDREQLRHRIEEDLLSEYTEEDARHDAIVMSAFDFFPSDFDLYGFTVDLFSEEIAGFYDPETNEFVLINEDDEFDTLEKLTHAHEYVHALQDQHFDLEQLDDDTLDSEASMALSALAEGDATMVQTLYLIKGYLSPEELLEALTESLQLETPILDEAPPVLVRELMFPYLEGVAFVEALYMNDGFDAVNRAWADPPKSTEHILHPERYLDGDPPQIVALAPLTDTLGAGWQQIDQDSVGELYLREYLVQQLDSQTVDAAATGWGGDQYAVFWNEGSGSLVLLLRLAWDTLADQQEFDNAYQGYPSQLFDSKARKQPDGTLCWEGDEVICLYSFAGETLISRAPNLDLATKVMAEQVAFMLSEEA